MKNAQLTCTSSPGSEPARIVLEGALTIRNAAGIRDELLEMLPRFDAFHIQVCQVVELDLSFVQLLLALRKSALTAGKKMTLEMDLSVGLQLLLKRSGLYDLSLTDPSP